MSLRAQFNQDLKDAMRTKDKMRLKTLRLIQTELKRADIAHKTAGRGEEIDAPAILGLLQRMIKQRHEVIKIFNDNDRPDAAAAEAAEIAIIETYLPQMMSESQTRAAIAATIADMGATSMAQMGKVVAAMRAAHPGELDMSLTSKLIKEALS